MNSGDRCLSGDKQFDMTNTSFGGAWTEEKLGILERYLDSYTTALKNQPFQLIYVDAFAGEGYWRPNSPYTTEDYGDFDDVRDGSARIALRTEDRPFDRFIFVEKDSSRCETLEGLKEEYRNRSIEINNADANDALIAFCGALGGFERAVVFLDPFATEVSWETVNAIAATKKIDCWMLFPLMAIARQMPRGQEPTEAWATNLDRIFGGRSFWHELYQPPPQLSFSIFEEDSALERPGGSGRIADAYRARLDEVFEKITSTRRVFKNSRNSPMFDLFFAASNPRGASIAVEIADHILKNW